MLSSTIWLAGIALEALLLFRAVRAKLAFRYLHFYLYILSLFLSDGLIYWADAAKLASADKWSWYAGFLSLFLGCGIVLEIFRNVLSSYAGVEKFARVASYVFLGAVICFAVVYPAVAPSATAARALFIRLQRDFLAVQGILLIVVTQLMAYYAIPIGRNLKGMILGYGQMLAFTLAGLALRAYIGHSFQFAWTMLQQLSYLAALVIWLIALWSYIPNPVPASRMNPDGDYDGLAARTRNMVGAAGSSLVKVERL
jgi:hypothetical protein